MDNTKANMYVMQYKDKVPADKLVPLKNALLKADESGESNLAMVSLKSHIVVLLMSIFFGRFGVDRFMVGDVALGLGKILCLVISFAIAIIPNSLVFSLSIAVILMFVNFIWWIVDIFICYKKVKEDNFKRILMALNQKV